MNGLINQIFPKVFPDVPSWVKSQNVREKTPVPSVFGDLRKQAFYLGVDVVPEGHLRINGQDVSEKKPVTEIAINVIPEGQRNDTLFKRACRLRAKNASFDTALSTIEWLNQKRCNPPLSETEVKNMETLFDTVLLGRNGLFGMERHGT